MLIRFIMVRRKVIGKYGFNIIQYQCLNLPGALAGLHDPGSCYDVRCHVMRSGPSRPAVWPWHHGYHGRGSCVSAGRIQCLGLPTQGFLVQLHWGEVFGTDLPAGRQDHSNQIQVQEWNLRSWASWLSAGMALWHFVDGEVRDFMGFLHSRYPVDRSSLFFTRFTTKHLPEEEILHRQSGDRMHLDGWHPVGRSLGRDPLAVRRGLKGGGSGWMSIPSIECRDF